MTDLSEAVSGRQNNGMMLNLMKIMAARFHRPLKVVAFNVNGIWRRRDELSKQLQDLHTDVSLLSETHLKPHERFFIPNYHFYRTDGFPGRQGIHHNLVDL
jgi:hypothetical protein